MKLKEQPDASPARSQRRREALAGLVLLLVASMATAACFGPSTLGPTRVARLLGQRLAGQALPQVDAAAGDILFEVRLPRVCLAVAVGAGLGLAGLAMQTLFRNPLASPYVLGVSSGAALGAALAMGTAGAGLARSLSVPPVAVAAGLATSLLVYGIARGAGGLFAHTLLLSGMAVAAFLSALLSLTVYLSGERLQELVFWLMGGLWRATWPQVALVGTATVLGYAALHVLRRPLDVLALGDRGARDVGLNVRRTKESLLVIGSVLASVAVAVSGVIGFVGLVVPHLARLVVGGAHRRLVPAAALGGGLLLLWADTAARSLREPVEVPVGIVTAVLGAPFFLFLLRRAGVRRASE